MEEKIIIFILSIIILYLFSYIIMKIIDVFLRGKDKELRFNLIISAFLFMIPFLIPWTFLMFIENLYKYVENKAPIFYIFLLIGYIVILGLNYKLLYIKKNTYYEAKNYYDDSALIHYMVKYPSETLAILFRFPLNIRFLQNVYNYSYIKPKDIPIYIFMLLISPQVIGFLISFYLIINSMNITLFDEVTVVHILVLMFLYYIIFIITSLLFNNVLFFIINTVEEISRRLTNKEIYMPSLIKYFIYSIFFIVISDILLLGILSLL